MKYFLFYNLIIFYLLQSCQLKAQTIASQNFEINPVIPELIFSNDGGNINTGNSTFGGTYGVAGSRGYFVNNNTAILTSAALDTRCYTNPVLTFNLAAISTANGNGMEFSDYVVVSISTDGSNFSRELRVRGFLNAYWSYSGGTGILAGTYDGNNQFNNGQTVNPVGSGNRTIDGYSQVTLSGLPKTATLYIRILMVNNESQEIWAIDNLVLSGTAVTPPSAVTVSGGGTFCPSAVLTASGGNGGTIYWQNNTSGGTSNNFPLTSKTVSSSGIYYFRAANNGGVCWGPEGSANVVITGNGYSQAPVISSYCINATSVSGTSSESNGTLIRLFKNGNFIGTATVTSGNWTLNNLPPLTPGEIYTATATAPGECEGNLSAAVTVSNLPVATAGGTTTICQNGSAVINGASALYGSVHWTHDGHGNLNNANSLTPVYNASGSDAGTMVTLTLTVTNTDNCTPVMSTATFTVNVEALPIATVNGNATVCENSSYTLPAGAAIASNGSILWTHNGNGTLTNQNTLTPTYTPSAADAGNTVNLTLKVTSNNICNPAFSTDVLHIAVIEKDNYYADMDMDGFGAGSIALSACSNPGVGYSLVSTDCDDNDNTIFPQPVAAETCNGKDDNCDGIIDNGVQCPKPENLTTTNITSTAATLNWDNIPCATAFEYRLRYQLSPGIWTPYGPWQLVSTNVVSISGLLPETIYQWQVRTYCFSYSAASTSNVFNTCNTIIFYQDNDADGFGNANAGIAMECTQNLPGYVTDNTDCNDNDNTINSDATELCDNIDQNCDGEISDGLNLYFQDNDGDNFGNPAITALDCTVPAGYITISGDCDDTAPGINPIGTEICDGVDNDCDMDIDEVSPCPKPVIEPTFVGVSFAVLHWTGSPCAQNGYEYRLRQLISPGNWSAFGPWIPVANNFATVTSLTGGNTYQYQVRSICSPGEFSIAVTSGNFTTNLLPLTSVIAEDPEISAFSQIESNSAVLKDQIVVFPNPSNGLIYLDITSELPDNEAVILISDLTGRMIVKKNFHLETGISRQEINFSEFPDGIYNLLIHSKEANISQKLIKAE